MNLSLCSIYLQLKIFAIKMLVNTKQDVSGYNGYNRIIFQSCRLYCSSSFLLEYLNEISTIGILVLKSFRKTSCVKLYATFAIWVYELGLICLVCFNMFSMFSKRL